MRQLFLLLILIPLNLFSAEPFVEIYKTHDNGLFGRSEDRDVILSIKESVFKRYETLPIDNEYNFNTAVTLNSEVVNKLNSIFENRTSAQFGFVKISKSDNIYTIEDDNIFLKLSFSVIEPNDELINMIKRHYHNNKKVSDLVTEYYENNYVINIHSAENILFAEAKEITYDEVMIMATIIGDKNQWLWGIHDGRDYLRTLLFK